MSIHRYRGSVLSVPVVSEFIATVIAITPAVNTIEIDVSLGNDANKPDLDEYMQLQGYTFVETAPATPPLGIGLLQTQFTRLAVLADKADAIFSDLLSTVIDTGPNTLCIWFNASFVALVSLSGARGEFRLQLDGVTLESVASNLSVLAEPQSVAVAFRTGVLAAGPHTVRVQWRSLSLLGLIRIDPTVVDPIGHADLLIQEVGQ